MSGEYEDLRWDDCLACLHLGDVYYCKDCLWHCPRGHLDKWEWNGKKKNTFSKLWNKIKNVFS